MARSADVVVARCHGYDSLRDVLSKAVDALGGLEIINDKIAIKVNLCDARPPETGVITHPTSLDALLWLLREHLNFDGDIYVVEGDSGSVLADQYVRWFGFLPVMERWRAHWLNITKAKKKVVRVNGRFFKILKLPEQLVDSFFISLAKLKTNVITRFTGILKNQFGCLPMVYKAKFHPWIDMVIGDINQVLRPGLGIVDGIIAHVGTKGPSYGMPVRANLVVVGADPVAIDTTCARILGFRPSSIGHIRECARRGLGRIRDFKIELIGFDGRDSLPLVGSLWSPIEGAVIRWLDKLRTLKSIGTKARRR